ncbi:N-acetylglucosamine-6-phosphate deacetylase [Thermanaerovibrio velox DSM 12556]|uniref:N-acetylglucosamine-6-phosphate deacetylase n=1 Tax=Thermanaerovibrio velox DSM 12556 TaxID=926567 RepID=H0UPW2_9BACT|nr:N-acetylglucosamine-6-phosphate deacetylase [Thermanaerovibrio velox]EHM10671.1 N-acetylglucosamine-6-phosphate deacetylase [Thermanaerovibrio velox DSM 12556]
MNALLGPLVVLPSGEAMEGTVVFDHVIREVIPGTRPLKGHRVMDCRGLWLTPGLMDLHIHGIGGHDACDGTPEALEAMSCRLASHGVTAFCPATMTLPEGEIRRVLGSIRSRMGRPMPGARLIGAHLEGPFISPERPGAQDRSFITGPKPELLEDFKDVIRIVTFAPERDPDWVLLDTALRLGITASAGHSNASYEEAQRAFMRGVMSVAHLFNGMAPYHHRTPGLVGAALDYPSVFCEVIVDGVHCHPSAVRLALKAKGEDKLVLISDSMRGAGLGDGTFSLGGQEVTVSQGVARLKEGAIAGSVITLDQAVRNYGAYTGLRFERAVKGATLNPANLLGDKTSGAIAPGRRADMVLWGPGGEVVRTYVNGMEVFCR